MLNRKAVVDRARSGCAVALVMGMATPTFAQEATPSPASPPPARQVADAAPAPSDSDPARQSEITDIVVTAQRREESLQRVPISVTAVTAQALDRANITSTTALQQVTPGLTWTSANRSALPFIRGVGTTDSTVGNENSVALYVDGVYIESSPASTLALNNVERIEVLKGPQGTLFGRNATGGLIQVVTKTPSRTPHANFEIGYGNYQTVRSALYLTGPVTSRIAADLALLYTNQNEGWGRNLVTGRDINLDRTFSARSKWLLDLDATRFTLTGDYTQQRTDIGSERNIVPGAVNPGNNVFRGGFYDSQSNLTPFGTLRTAGISLTAEHDFAAARLTSISSYRDTLFSTILDQDETPLPVVDSLQREIRIRAFTHEVQLAGTGGGPLEWIVGTFYMHRHGFQPDIELRGLAFAGAPFFGAFQLDDGVVTESIAPYGQVTYEVAPGTKLTGGVRYTIEHQHFTGTQTSSRGVILASVDDTATYRKATFRLAASQQLGGTLLYASFNRGFKGGVFNVNNLAAPPAQPEVLDALEAGIKADLTRSLRLNAAVFHYAYSNIQLLVAGNQATGAISTTINAARARIVGLEGSIDAVPLHGLTLNLGAAYMPTAKYLSFPDAPLFVTKPGGGNTLVSFDNSGNRMVRAPELTMTASIAYVIPLATGDLDLGVNYYRSSSFVWNSDARYRQPPYDVLNGQVAYRLRGGVSLAVWGRNLLQEKYRAGLSETTAGDVYIPAAPRTYGVKLGYTF